MRGWTFCALQVTALRVAVGVTAVNHAVWSVGMLVFFGATFACFGAAAAASGRFPAWFGWIAVAGGAGSAVAALVEVAGAREIQAAETLFLVSSVLLTLWLLALGIALWRMAAPAASRKGAGQTGATARAAALPAVNTAT